MELSKTVSEGMNLRHLRQLVADADRVGMLDSATVRVKAIVDFDSSKLFESLMNPNHNGNRVARIYVGDEVPH